MRNFNIKFKPFKNSFPDHMNIQAETLLKAADQFKDVFPKGKILEIQPDEALDNFQRVFPGGIIPDNVIYRAFSPQPNRKAEGEPEGELIHVDFKLKVRIT